MEDWEEFFVEKSRRRAEKERVAHRRQRIVRTLSLLIITALIVAGLVALGMRE